MTERKRQQRVSALRRAGLEYVDRSRLPKAVAQPTAAAVATDKQVTSAPAPAITPVNLSLADRLPLLDQLRSEVAGCTQCSALAPCRTQTVFADGSPMAELCFVGEAPGADEDLQGVPFVGRAGQLLTRIIEACHLKREEVYICNVLKCRPPENRNPMPDEIEHCRPFLERQLAIVRPKMLVALGKFAAAHLLREDPARVPIMRLRGQIREYCGIPFMITLHPAYLLRNPSAKRDVWEDMKTVMRQLGRPID